MTSINESLARGIARDIMRAFDRSIPNNDLAKIGTMPRRKQARELIKFCKRDIRLAFLGERYTESSKWQVIWGEWSLTLKSSLSEDNKYDKIGFDLTVDIPKLSYDKHLYIVLSKHALERLIMRSNMPLNTLPEIRNFLNSIIKKLVLNCLAMWDKEPNSISLEGYAVIGDLYIPIVMEVGINIRGKIARAFTIKTIMPVTYEGAIKSMSIMKQNQVKTDIFEYWNLLEPPRTLTRL